MNLLLRRLSITLFVLFLASIADIVLYLVFDARGDVLRILPGQRREVVGKLPETVQNINILPREDDPDKEALRVTLLNDKVLTQHAELPGLSIRFLDLRGRVWRGELTADGQTPPGAYAVEVLPRERPSSAPPPAEPSTVQVRVFADAAAMRASHVSLSERYLGFGPWWLVLGIMPLAGGLLAWNYRLAGRTEADMRDQGLGPIYRLTRNKDHWELVFGLGSNQGLAEGDELVLLDANRRRLCSLTAERVEPEMARAKLPLDAPVSPFGLVARSGDVPSDTAAS